MTNPDILPEDQIPVEPVAESVAETVSDTAALEAQIANYKDQALRALAEVENTRRRAIKEREDATKYGVSSLAKELLGVADNLRRALDAAGTQESEGAKVLVTGVEATERQLLSAFERVGIKKIEPLDVPFDPNFHRVMMEMENTGKPSGTIVQVLQPGYVIHDRLLREALVAIAKGEASAQTGAVNTSA